MSSPIHHDKDVDPALVYAPRRAREQTQQVSTLPAVPQIELRPAASAAIAGCSSRSRPCTTRSAAKTSWRSPMPFRNRHNSSQMVDRWGGSHC